MEYQKPTFIRCFDHVEQDMRKVLHKEGKNKTKVNRICTQFLVSEFKGKRTKGLVDSANEEEFQTRYENMKLSLSSTFIKWLESMEGRVRSLIDTMKKCMLKPVRVMAGLGDPPNKWSNNATESIHNIIKEAMNNESLDAATFLERVKLDVFNQQLNEFVRGIQGLGEYRLIDSKKNIGIDPIQ